MWKTSLKTAVLQPFTSNLIFLSTVILTIALSWQIRFFPEFLVKYNHRIQGKKAVRKVMKENTFPSLTTRIIWKSICIPHAADVLIMIPAWSMPV